MTSNTTTGITFDRSKFNSKSVTLKGLVEVVDILSVSRSSPESALVSIVLGTIV